MLIPHVFSLKHWIFVAIIIATDAFATTPFSQYGMIQNVQNYSNTPFYNSNSYLNSTPKIVYDSGPGLKPGDCEKTVSALIENECAKRKNCQDTTLSDIRPSIMVQLSTLPGYNYASSCSGYIDTIFANYVRQNQLTGYVDASATFPTVSPTTQPAQNIPKWQSEYNERANELKELQSQTKTTTDNLTASAFPKTFEDLPLEQQLDIKRQGYEPYKDANAYVPLKIKRDENAYKTTNDVINEEANAVYTCMAELDAAETAAADAFPDEFTRAPDAAKKRLTQAVFNAKYSACTCTEGKRFQDKLRQDMDVKCNKTSKQKAEKAATDYVNDAVALVTPAV